MNFLIIISALAAILFIAAFLSKRRIGIPGLALLAGATLSGLWGDTATFIVEGLGIRLAAPPLEVVVGAVIVLFPALLLLLSGPTYQKGVQRIFGSLAFALLAVSLLLEPLSQALVIEGVGKTVYELLVQYHVTIITVCVIFAILDLFATKIPKLPRKH